MDGLPSCPKCKCEYTYENGSLFVCTECDHEWSTTPVVPVDEKRVWKDAYGNELKDGDAIQVIKDLKVKGSSSSVKVGTKVKNIRLIDGDHDISCKIEGFGPYIPWHRIDQQLVILKFSSQRRSSSLRLGIVWCYLPC